MSRSDGYHHGDLRRALLGAATDLLEQRGVEGLTLREVARRAGVSHAAPYHHFADRAALIAALVESGFRQLTLAMQTAAAAVGGEAPSSSLDRLHATGVAYVLFAVEHPALFRLLCRPELFAPSDDGLSQAGREAYAVLVDSVQACLRGGEVAGDADALALSAWCSVHGLATLLLDGPLVYVRTAAGAELDVERLAQTVTETLSNGLRPRV